MSKGITVREVGTDSPNIGTLFMNNDSIFNHVDNGVLMSKLIACLTSHYDADVLPNEDLPLEQIEYKGEADLSITVGDDYTTIITLELTWVY